MPVLGEDVVSGYLFEIIPQPAEFVATVTALGMSPETTLQADLHEIGAHFDVVCAMGVHFFTKEIATRDVRRLAIHPAVAPIATSSASFQRQEWRRVERLFPHVAGQALDHLSRRDSGWRRHGLLMALLLLLLPLLLLLMMRRLIPRRFLPC